MNDTKLKNGMSAAEYIRSQTEEIRSKVGGGKAVCAMSGGVDSTVSAVLTHKAIGDALTCIFVDHGFMRKNEREEVETLCREKFNMNLIAVDARERFLSRLRGVTDPEKKRKIIGEEFIRVFEEEAEKLTGADFLVQGTIYPDIVESGTDGKGVVKSHHNVGGLPEDIRFSGIIEPVRYLYKNEVRQVGLELGIDEALVWRQPFPGPGLAVRVVGELTAEKLDIVREADAIFREEIINAGLHRELSQYFAVLTDIKSVGVREGERAYGETIALRAVTTSDFMTADFARIPYETLARASSRITSEVRDVNRVVYDITAKPPATIEFE